MESPIPKVEVDEQKMSVSKSTAFLPSVNNGNITFSVPTDTAHDSNFAITKAAKVKSVYSIVYDKDMGTYTKQFN